MECFIFARFHALPDREAALEAAILEVLAPTRAEAGCLDIHAFRSTRDARLYFIHSRWRDEAAFELHATLPHTARFIERAEALIDHELDVTRSTLVS